MSLTLTEDGEFLQQCSTLRVALSPKRHLGMSGNFFGFTNGVWDKDGFCWLLVAEARNVVAALWRTAENDSRVPLRCRRNRASNRAPHSDQPGKGRQLCSQTRS